VNVVSIPASTTTKYSSIVGNIIKTLTGHTNSVLSLAVLPDGSLASGSGDKTIKIWDTIKGIEIKTLTGHTSEVLSLAVLPDGSLASGSYQKILIYI
jgi:WD40 repeat protein